MATGLMTDTLAQHLPVIGDRVRMQRDRLDRLQTMMRSQGVDALILLANDNVMYATGLVWPLSDAGRSAFERPVAVVLVDDPSPHVFLPMRSVNQHEVTLPADHVHGAVYLEVDEGVAAFVASLAEIIPSGARLAIDEWTHAMAREHTLLFTPDAPTSAGKFISRAKLVKTPDEIAFMREALRITEVAVADVQRRIEPGVRQSDLTATYMGSIFAAGAEANVMDPIWQVMPRAIADGPWTTTGDVPCPLLTTERVLERGDVLWVDVSLTYGGFHSDFGRTWVVGGEPDAQQRDQFARWRAILDATLGCIRGGAKAGELTAAARAAYGGNTPWLPHFYLGHGLGIGSAEMPFIGSDMGPAFDDSYVLQSGMVLVLEPIVWDDGAAGYRAEEVVLVTDDGWLPMTDYPYDPF